MGRLRTQMLISSIIVLLIGLSVSCNPVPAPASIPVAPPPPEDEVIYPAPVLSAVEPAYGVENTQVAIMLQGIGFREGLRIVVGNESCENIEFLNSGEVKCLTPALPLGVYDVTIANIDNKVGKRAYAFTFGPPPSILEVTPPNGAAKGGTLIEVKGTGFMIGAEVTLGGDLCTSAEFINDQTLTCITSAHVPGSADVVVKALDGRSATLENAYTFNQLPPPVVTSVSSTASPSSAGNVEILIHGDKFFQTALADPKVYVGGDENFADVNLCGEITFINEQKLRCVLPPHSNTHIDTPVAVPVFVVNPGGPDYDINDRYGKLAIDDPNHFEYTPPPMPQVGLVLPVSGYMDGNTLLTISGSNFTKTATVRIMYELPNGDPAIAPCNEVKFLSAGELTCVTSAIAPLANDTMSTVSVINPYDDGDDEGILENSFTYKPSPPPTIGIVSPASGLITGGTTIYINGTRFKEDDTSVLINNRSCDNVRVITASQLSCVTPAYDSVTMPAPPPHATVTILNQGALPVTKETAFEYVAPPPPTITSVSPASGKMTEGQEIFIQGANFIEGLTIQVGDATCVKTVDPPLRVIQVLPEIGKSDGGDLLSIIGTNFVDGVTVTLGGVACGSVNFVSDQMITCITPPHGTELVDLVVENPDTTSVTKVDVFSYVPADDANLDPDFVPPTAPSGDPPIDANTFYFMSSSMVRCTVPALNDNTKTGMPMDVVLTNPEVGGTAAQGVTKQDAYTFYSAPVIGAMTSYNGFSYEKTAVTITGQYFQQNISVTFGGRECTNLVWNNAGSVTCDIPESEYIIFNNAFGDQQVDVVVTNGAYGQSDTEPNYYTYKVPLDPTVTEVVDNFDYTIGGKVVTVKGTNFYELSQVASRLPYVRFGTYECTDVTLLDAGNLECVVPENFDGKATPLDDLSVNVTVSNPNGEMGEAVNAFTYNPSGDPKITGISPDFGNAWGNREEITITGENFLPNAEVYVGAELCETSLVVSTTKIVCKTPENPTIVEMTGSTPSLIAGKEAAIDRSFSILVINADGQQVDSDTIKFRYDVPASPTITSIEPATGKTAGDTLVYIKGTGFVPGQEANTFLRIDDPSIANSADDPKCIVQAIVDSETLTCKTTPHANKYTKFAVEITNYDGETGVLADAFAYNECPVGYSMVFKNEAVGVPNDFCVMKYEAKAKIIDDTDIDSDGCYEYACTKPNWGLFSHEPVSVEEGKPWRMIDMNEAKALCQNIPGGDYDLISNPEWMAIARSIESHPANWTGSSVGVGSLKRGNSGGEFPFDDGFYVGNTGYNGNDPDGGGGRSSTALSWLSSGEQVWDIAGNVYEWVDWTTGDVTPTLVPYENKAYFSTMDYQDFGEFKNLDVNIGAGDLMAPSTWQPLHTTYDSSRGIGMYFAGINLGVLEDPGTDFGAAQAQLAAAITANDEAILAQAGTQATLDAANTALQAAIDAGAPDTTAEVAAVAAADTANDSAVDVKDAAALALTEAYDELERTKPQQGAALRGGDWSRGMAAGIYSLILNVGPTYVSPRVGFRCVYHLELTP